MGEDELSRRLLVLVVVNVVSSGSDANWSGDSELISTSTITEEDDEDLLLFMDGRLLKYAIVPQSAKMDRITPAFFGLDMLFVMVLMPKAGGRFERRVVIYRAEEEELDER